MVKDELHFGQMIFLPGVGEFLSRSFALHSVHVTILFSKSPDMIILPLRYPWKDETNFGTAQNLKV
jgi:hypothetical protein